MKHIKKGLLLLLAIPLFVVGCSSSNAIEHSAPGHQYTLTLDTDGIIGLGKEKHIKLSSLEGNEIQIDVKSSLGFDKESYNVSQEEGSTFEFIVDDKSYTASVTGVDKQNSEVSLMVTPTR